MISCNNGSNTLIFYYTLRQVQIPLFERSHSQMVKCERCGARNEGDYIFCISCGNRISGQSIPNEKIFISTKDSNRAFRKEEIDIDQITRERLKAKSSFFASLALSTRLLYTRILYAIIIVGFILFLLYSMNMIINTTLLGLTISIIMILLIPKAVGNQIWETERAKALLDYNPSSPRAAAYRLVTLIRWFYSMSAIIILLLLLGGLLKGYW